MEALMQIAANGGIGGVLAYVVLRWQRSDLLKRAAECKSCADRMLAMAESERADKLMVLEVVRGNTEALTRLVDAVRTLTNGDGRLDYDEVPQ